VTLALFGPARDEVDQVAHDLIVTHGLSAYAEAVRLSNIVSLLPHAPRESKLYRLAGARIKTTFEAAREKLRETRTSDFSVLRLVGHLNAHEDGGPRPAERPVRRIVG
jgi:hypothetical protein